MIRTAVLVVLCGVAAAAPVPKETDAQRLRRVYGTTADPTEKAAIILGGGDRLVIRSPDRTVNRSGDRAGWPSDSPKTAPRTARVLTGDFVLTVRQLAPAAPELSPSTDTGRPQVFAGLYVMAPEEAEDTVAVGRRFDRLLNKRGMANPPGQVVWLEQEHAAGASGAKLAEAAADRPVYLRLARSGGRITAYTSADGKAWGDGAAVDRAKLPDKVAVGVFLTHMVFTECETAFDQFTLTQPTK